MRLFKLAAGGMFVASTIAATAAMAAQPMRSASALPGGATVTAANFRTATPLRHKSDQSDGGAPVLGYALAAVVAGGIVAAAIAGTDNHRATAPSSPG